MKNIGKPYARFDVGGLVMAIYGLVIETPQNESGGNTDRSIPNDGRSLSSTLFHELSAKIETVGDKVDGMDARDSAQRRKVDGHEDRIRFLERGA